MITIIDVLESLKVKNWTLRGNGLTETEFHEGFTQNRSKNPNEWSITWSEVSEKFAELEAAEPMRLLRIERDRLLQQTDWEIQRNTERNIDSTELITYRNALRDLPQDISANNVPSPTLDENGMLLFDHWPNRYEINIENTQTANNSANTV